MDCPRYFANKILYSTLTQLFGNKFAQEIMCQIPSNDNFVERVSYIMELIQFVNSDNRYKLCVVNRRTNKWAIFLLTPYGTVGPEELSFAFGWSYDSNSNSVIFDSIKELGDALEELGFNSSAIAEAFIDCDKAEV